MLTTFLLPLLGASLAMASQSSHNLPSPLSWDVYLASETPVYDPAAPNLTFSPTAFTLIHGPKTAILIDAPLTTNTTHTLADWISATIPNKTLTHVYITHGHGDHFFGVPILQSRFPGLIALATEHTIEHIAQQVAEPYFSSFWGSLFPAQIPPQDVSWQAVPRHGGLELDGHAVNFVEVGQSDTYNTSVVHVPSLELVVTGDAVYGSCYQFLMESNTTKLRGEWIAAINEIERLGVKHVVPSHMQAGEGYGTEHLEATKEYIGTWGRELETAESAKELEARIKELYPERIGEFILRLSAEGGIPA